MLKVSKRERMILGLTAAAVIWGARVLMPTPAKDSQPAANAKMTAVKEFISGLGALIKEHSPPEKIIYAIRAAETEWGGDPFSETHEKATATTPAAKPAEEFDYSGYLEMNNRRLAVIDGVEYEAGDLLEGDGFKVKDIFPHMVVVESMPGGKEIKVNLHGIRENRGEGDDVTEAGPSPKRQTLNVYGNAD